MMFRTVTASRISRTSQLLDNLGHLCSFALCAALPRALAGRDTRDYYEHSVTIGLAPRRRSHVPSPSNISLARRRCPTHALERPRWASPIVQDLPPTKVNRWVAMASECRRATDERDGFRCWTLGFK